MIVTSHAAQMIMAGHEAGPGAFSGGALIHNDGPSEIYIDTTPNIFNGPGSPQCTIPQYGALVLAGGRTYWARARDGMVAQVHIMPTVTYGNLGPTPATG